MFVKPLETPISSAMIDGSAASDDPGTCDSKSDSDDDSLPPLESADEDELPDWLGPGLADLKPFAKTAPVGPPVVCYDVVGYDIAVRFQPLSIDQRRHEERELRAFDKRRHQAALAEAGSWHESSHSAPCQSSHCSDRERQERAFLAMGQFDGEPIERAWAMMPNRPTKMHDEKVERAWAMMLNRLIKMHAKL
ncbi:hypothetical protein FB451DRAFT_1410410 [Mycena latifolia]|nr:hypothetical protein FB451DRAFT_1410410 [Mycena latifolia]